MLILKILAVLLLLAIAYCEELTDIVFLVGFLLIILGLILGEENMNEKMTMDDFMEMYELSCDEMEKVILLCELLGDDRDGVWSGLQDEGIDVDISDLYALDI